ncbi:hypothetical protein OsccyDRAFT_0945 [Leptolyngbyaceae cyanobacterium JSC-12]|nr:hypothetical protein OsccyDRAFT_0945 [Leptolyngbyaceae cyanobacterium JSC-12]
MVLGLLGLALLISVIATQLVVMPIQALSSWHLPLLVGAIPYWLNTVSTWVIWGGLLLGIAWLLGDR